MDRIIREMKELQNKPFYELMELLLYQLNIKNENDVCKLSIGDMGFIKDELLNDSVRILLCAAQRSATRNVIEAHKNKKQFFLHQQSYINQDTSYLDSYSMLFPNRFVLYTSDIYLNSAVGIEGTNVKLGYAIKAGSDLLKYYIRHKDAISNGDLFIFPQAVYQESASSKYVEVPNCAKLKNKCFLDRGGKDISIIPQTNHANLILELPWLKNADVREFIELRDKYKTEYSQFLLKIDQLMLMAKDGNQIETLLAKEYNEASLEIKNIILKQKKELQKKGKEMAIGTFCTIIPIALKEAGVELFNPEILSSVIGGKTLYNGIVDYCSCRHQERDNPFWILYKWEEQQKKKT